VLGVALGVVAGGVTVVAAGVEAGAAAGAVAALRKVFVPFVENEYSFFKMPAS
jgi:hypothetical protein